jgi:hypothetical protein
MLLPLRNLELEKHELAKEVRTVTAEQHNASNTQRDELM